MVGAGPAPPQVARAKHRRERKLDIKSMALGVILGVLVVLVVLVLNNHTGDLIKDAVANTAPLVPMLLTDAAALNPDGYMDAWNMRQIVQEAMVGVLGRRSIFVTEDTDDNQIFCEYAAR